MDGVTLEQRRKYLGVILDSKLEQILLEKDRVWNRLDCISQLSDLGHLCDGKWT